MKRLKRLSVAILVIAMLAVPSTAMASYAFDYGNTNGMTYGDDCVYEANRMWGTLGLTYSSYIGSTFTKSTFLNNCATGNGVYAYTHGSADAISDNSNSSSNYIYRSDVSSKRGTDWKRLVFLDACRTADNSNWASAWGISNGDGSSHAFIGWKGESQDSWNYYVFTTEFLYWVKNKKTIQYALDQARIKTSISHYGTYGSTSWSY